jgi:hypothetical protein
MPVQSVANGRVQLQWQKKMMRKKKGINNYSPLISLLHTLLSFFIFTTQSKLIIMKRLSLLLAVIIFFTACKKTMKEDLLQNITAAPSGNITANITPAPAYRWVAMTVPPFTGTHTYKPERDNVVIPAGNDYYCVGGRFTLSEWYKLNSSTRQWEYQPGIDYGFLSSTDPSWQYLFAYQSKVYAGMGWVGGGTANWGNHFGSFDPATNARTTLASFPGIPSSDFTAFVIGDKGYIMGGTNATGTVNQLWEYNFATNQWLNKGGSPLGERARAAVIVKDGKAYMGLGYDVITLNGQKITGYKNDWMLYDPASGFAAVKADFPGGKRAGIKGFVINDAVYAGFGYTGSSSSLVSFNDFWKYNTSSNTWTQEANYPGSAITNRFNSSAFSIGSTGYVVKGDLAEFYRFTNSAF